MNKIVCKKCGKKEFSTTLPIYVNLKELVLTDNGEILLEGKITQTSSSSKNLINKTIFRCLNCGTRAYYDKKNNTIVDKKSVSN